MSADFPACRFVEHRFGLGDGCLGGQLRRRRRGERRDDSDDGQGRDRGEGTGHHSSRRGVCAFLTPAGCRWSCRIPCRGETRRAPAVRTGSAGRRLAGVRRRRVDGRRLGLRDRDVEVDVDEQHDSCRDRDVAADGEGKAGAGCGDVLVAEPVDPNPEAGVEAGGAVCGCSPHHSHGQPLRREPPGRDVRDVVTRGIAIHRHLAAAGAELRRDVPACADRHEGVHRELRPQATGFGQPVGPAVGERRIDLGPGHPERGRGADCRPLLARTAGLRQRGRWDHRRDREHNARRSHGRPR